ncbi:hypothetical protein D9611_011082 [Ephemerocybe angulata]|uniref:Uncharacterized protein n=1 Tax=Ephemerocybe angulata TaxID=980116 RepID=A0A8H5BD34_9AGAR|nr:hypothetical protein D9611_011082 [Tulosesus angulatus]
MGGFIIRERDGCIHYFDIGSDLGDEIWTTPLAFNRHVSTHGLLSSIVTSTLPERDGRSPHPYHVRPQASSVGGSGTTREAHYAQSPCTGHHQESLEYHRALLHARVTQDEIWDRSKGDALTKSFVILQTLWFAIQSAARWIRHLESTHLEVTTLAYVALNGVMYFFWWDKPLDVQSPIVIDLGHQELLQPGSHLSFECQYGQPKDGKNTRRSLDPIDLPRHPPQLYIPNHEEKDEAPHELSKTPDHPSQHILNSLSHRVRNWLANLFWGFISRLKSIVEYNIGREESQAFHAEPQRFPMFYALGLAPLTGSYSMVTANHSLTQLMGLVLASAFGAIHCIAWNFKTGSSPVPQLLWRISSLCIAASPGILILVFVLIFFVQWPWRRPLIRLTMSFGTFIVKLKVVGQVAIMVYIPARTVLLFLAFYDLKWLSPSTHRTVEWSSFIPHLG